jgi:signal recognition particle receptor subunit beta
LYIIKICKQLVQIKGSSMATINYAAREINVKIVYYGPALSGKTTNLQIIHKKTPDKSKSDMVSLATEADRTLFFDFLPIDLGKIRGFTTKIQLYTVPGQVYYNATRKLVLRGVDGIVFVADSSAVKMPENIESLDNMEENLAEYGYALDTIPIVLQFNKRDIGDALSVEELKQQLNRYNSKCAEGIAFKGDGVFETLKLIGKEVIDLLNKKYSNPSASANPQPQVASQGGLQRPPTPQQPPTMQPPVQQAAPQNHFQQPPAQQAAPQNQFQQAPAQQAAPQNHFQQPPAQHAAPQNQFQQPPAQQAAPQNQFQQPPAQQAAPQNQFQQPPAQHAAPQNQFQQAPAQQAAPQNQFQQPPAQSTAQQNQFQQPTAQAASQDPFQQTSAQAQFQAQQAAPQNQFQQPSVQPASQDPFQQQQAQQPVAAPQNQFQQPPAQPASQDPFQQASAPAQFKAQQPSAPQNQFQQSVAEESAFAPSPEAAAPSMGGIELDSPFGGSPQGSPSVPTGGGLELEAFSDAPSAPTDGATIQMPAVGSAPAQAQNDAFFNTQQPSENSGATIELEILDSEPLPAPQQQAADGSPLFFTSVNTESAKQKKKPVNPKFKKNFLDNLFNGKQ